ncbi:MAG: T9SS type A sorting domain-containing protein [Bacteroidota bacterium]
MYNTKILGFVLLCGIVLIVFVTGKEKQMEQSGAGLAMDAWAMTRSYPSGRIATYKWAQAHAAKQLDVAFRDTDNANWEALGPKNIGGRTLCLAFHPSDSSIIYAGAAGGGLWKTTTAGVGAAAWEYISTGFPVIGVGAIAIDPQQPDVMYIGTGEVYNYTAARPGVVNRLTRGSYGIGILKTTDGGATWNMSLDWSLSELTGIQDLKIDPSNSDIVYAATTKGLYRTTDAGASWENIHDNPMATDVEIHPSDSQTIFVANGGYLSPSGAQGVYVSRDGGENFSRISESEGLPVDYEGKTRLSIHPTQPDIMYASVADVFQSRGLYRSEDGGRTWSNRNTTDVARYQGWYAHDVAVSPTDPNLVIHVGIDVHRSEDGGDELEQVSEWSAWFLTRTIAGEPEGPNFYVHADIHAVYFSPHQEQTVYVATDGGIFCSQDNGKTWAGRNGGYQTQQFYANFANSTTNPDLAIGGMQDNATAIYLGDGNWKRVVGGDGMSAAIDPRDDSRMYASYQNLNVIPSFDGGERFSFSNRWRISHQINNEQVAFNGPYELAPSNPDVVYAGAQRLHRSDDAGETWAPTAPGFIDRGNPIITLEVAPQNEQLVYIATSPQTSGFASVYQTKNGGRNLSRMDGLPDRVAMDFAIDPTDENVVYVVYSGFDVRHLYKTVDGGATWLPHSDGLPDVPTNAVCIDPFDSNIVYVGNDIGVYVSEDSGATWSPFMNQLPDAVMVMDLSISLPNRQLRVATHGHGVYQTRLLSSLLNNTTAPPSIVVDWKLYPNPTADELVIDYHIQRPTIVDMQIFDAAGQQVQQVVSGQSQHGVQQKRVSVTHWTSGIYYVQLQTEQELIRKTFIVQ